MANSRPVISLYDEPMWESIRAERMALQKCGSCGKFRYPPGPACDRCLAMDYAWVPLQGGGKILSWVIFHRQYFDNFPPPYNVVAVELAEGPIMMSNLVGALPEGSWIGREVTLCYERDLTGETIPKVRLSP